MAPSHPHHDDLDQLELFFGESSPAQSRIYARLPVEDISSDRRLSGWIRGPQCEYAATLPATVPLASVGPGESLLAQGLLPDPCFWTPQMPYLYHVGVELHERSQVSARTERPFGIRRLGVKDRRLFFDDRSWMLRAAESDEVPTSSFTSWRDAAAAMYVRDVDETLCGEASRLGVLLVVEVFGPTEEVTESLRRLARWPAVGLAVVASSNPLSESIRIAAPNLLLAQRFGPAEAIKPAAWAQLVICEDQNTTRLAARAASSRLPVIAMRSCGKRTDVSTARAECDHLQSDLARRGEFVGYIV